VPCNPHAALSILLQRKPSTAAVIQVQLDTDKQTDRWTDGRRDGHTEDRQKNRQRDRQKGTQTAKARCMNRWKEEQAVCQNIRCSERVTPAVTCRTPSFALPEAMTTETPADAAIHAASS